MDDDWGAALHSHLQLGKDAIDGIGGHEIRLIRSKVEKAPKTAWRA
jgi:hypothetical protein